MLRNEQTNKTIATTTTFKKSTEKFKRTQARKVFFLNCIPLHVYDDSECLLGNEYYGIRENKITKRKRNCNEILSTFLPENMRENVIPNFH